MTDRFFSASSRIRYEGPDSADSARLPLVRRRARRARQADGASTCASRSATGTRFCWPGIDMFGGETFDAPVVRRRRSDGAGASARPRWRSSSSASSACRSSPSTIATSPPRRATLAATNAQLDRIVEQLAAHMAAHRRAAAVGHGQPVQPPPLRRRRRDQSRSRGVRLRRGAGEEGDGGHAPARRRQLRALGRARGLRHAAQHRPAPRARPARPLPAAGGRAQARASASPARC